MKCGGGAFWRCLRGVGGVFAFTMKIYHIPQIVLTEVPGEVSIGIMVANCPYKCQGCSYRGFKTATEFSLKDFEELLLSNYGLATCVVFMGGCWNPEMLLPYLDLSKAAGYKNCLYSGLTDLDLIDQSLLNRLDFVKVGRWTGIPISDPQSNQRFYDVKTGMDLSSRFRR